MDEDTQHWLRLSHACAHTCAQIYPNAAMHTYEHAHIHTHAQEENGGASFSWDAWECVEGAVGQDQAQSGRKVDKRKECWTTTKRLLYPRSSHHSVAIFFFFCPDFSAYDGNTYFCLTSR